MEVNWPFYKSKEEVLKKQKEGKQKIIFWPLISQKGIAIARLAEEQSLKLKNLFYSLQLQQIWLLDASVFASTALINTIDLKNTNLAQYFCVQYLQMLQYKQQWIAEGFIKATQINLQNCGHPTIQWLSQSAQKIFFQQNQLQQCELIDWYMLQLRSSKWKSVKAKDC